jgi:hypothetical protein
MHLYIWVKLHAWLSKTWEKQMFVKGYEWKSGVCHIESTDYFFQELLVQNNLIFSNNDYT